MKDGEISYLRQLGEEGAIGACDKPFSETGCATNLVGMGLVMSLLPAPPSSVLDLGCGTGWTSWFLALHGHRVLGQDIAPDMIDFARQNKSRFQANSADFVVSDYETLEMDEAFDAALFYDSLHHAEDEKAALACAYRSLKKGGVLVTHEPGRGHSTAPASVAAMQRFGVNEKDMQPSRIFALGREVGFRSFKRYLDPVAVCRTAYGINLETHQSSVGAARMVRSLAGLLRRIVSPEYSAICVLRK